MILISNLSLNFHHYYIVGGYKLDCKITAMHI